MVSSRLGEVVHGSEEEVLYLYYLRQGQSEEVEIGSVLERQFVHLLFSVEDLSQYLWFEPTASFSEDVAVRTILK